MIVPTATRSIKDFWKTRFVPLRYCVDDSQSQEFQTALEGLLAGIQSGNHNEVERILSDLEFLTLENGGWPAGFFDSLRELLKDPNFLGLTKSWQLLYFINNNWEYLSDRDAAGLREVLVDTFDKHSDWMGAFVTSEILGNHYTYESILAVLARLGQNARLPERSLAPYGIETLARAT
jgi:hypothetical protein